MSREPWEKPTDPAQEEQNEELARAADDPVEPEKSADEARDFIRLMRAAGRAPAYDPIASAMERHPGLTREKAERMAREFGLAI